MKVHSVFHHTPQFRMKKVTNKTFFEIDFIHFLQFRNPLEQLRNELNKLDTQINKIQTQMKAPNTHPDVKQQMSNFLPVR